MMFVTETGYSRFAQEVCILSGLGPYPGQGIAFKCSVGINTNTTLLGYMIMKLSIILNVVFKGSLPEHYYPQN